MCGRYALGIETERIVRRFDVTEILLPPDKPFEPAQQIMPTQMIPVITAPAESAQQGHRLEAMRWGLVPHFAREEEASGRPLINARAETLANRPMFRDSFRRRRCLIPSDAFYEWGPMPGQSPASKNMVRFELKSGEPFAFAGVWDIWRAPGSGEKLISTCIITCEPNELVEPVHNRMPAILRADDENPWLNADYDLGLLNKMLAPYPADEMRAELCVTEPKSRPEKSERAKGDKETLSLF